MTSTINNSKISLEDHLEETGQMPLLCQVAQEWRELVKAHCVEVYSLSPLHQAAAKKNPNYWRELGTMGGWNIPGQDWEEFLARRVKELQAQQLPM